MKKTTLYAIVFVVLIPIAAQAKVAGKIVALEGRADITSPGKTAAPATVGTAVSVGDIIRTKSASKLEILLNDGSKLRIARKTRLEIEEYMAGKESTKGRFNLFRGKVMSIIKKTGKLFGKDSENNFEVRTKTAVIGVRGTEFITYRQPGLTGAVFTDGEGYCYNPNLPETVKHIRAGEAMQVADAYRPPLVRPYTDVEVQQHMKDTAPVETEGGDQLTRGMPDSEGDERADREGMGPEPGEGPEDSEGSEAGAPPDMGGGHETEHTESASEAPEGLHVAHAVVHHDSKGNVEIPYSEHSPAVAVSVSDVAPTEEMPPCDMPECVSDIPDDFLPDSLSAYVGDNPDLNTIEGERMTGLSETGEIPGSSGQALVLNATDGLTTTESAVGGIGEQTTTILDGTYESSESDGQWGHPLNGWNADGGQVRAFSETYWTGDELAARGYMGWVDLASGTTGVSGGKIAGLFDPAEQTFRTAETWTAVETQAFLSAAATEAGRSSLTQADIPCVEIGKANLSGASDIMNLSMNNVTFFAYSTGATPRIWASGDVAGSWSAAPGVGHTVDISGDGLAAGFEVKNWDAGSWGANVSGNGTLSRTDTGGSVSTSFSGGAAGTYSGTSSGDFSGTAAGVVNDP